MICKFIEEANKEYTQNGRSAKFVAMENKICKFKKPLHVYFFARYVKGADIERLRDLIIEVGTMEECYYFLKYISGMKDLRLFTKIAVKYKNHFWIDKFIELAVDEYGSQFIKDAENVYKDISLNIDVDAVLKHAGIYDVVVNYQYTITKSRLGKISFDVDYAIEQANKEYMSAGRSDYYVNLEKLALHNSGPACSVIFAKNVYGSNIRAFERVALLRGDPFHMFLVATQVPQSNKELMLKGLKLAKLDYKALDIEWEEKQKRKEEIIKILQEVTDVRERRKLTSEYMQITDKSAYVAKIDNDYITRINYVKNNSVGTKK